MRALLLSLALVAPAVAAAETSRTPDELGWHRMGKGYCGTTHATPSAGIARATSSHVLFVNRCTGGCTFTKATVANAPQNVHAVEGVQANVSIPEFANKAGATGAAADEEWNAIMACVRETESYYNIEVVDQRPASGSYHMASVGGLDDNLGFASGNGQLLGISQLACGGLDNVISFTLAGESRLLAGNSSDYVRDVCKTIVHEAGHAFGLEHAMRWLDDASSTCSDPMSYDTATCDPSPAYFRNRLASCGTSFGEGMDMPYGSCTCGANNPHEKMLAVFGTGNPTVPPPTVAITTPAASGALSTFVAANAGSKRGVARVDLYLNGWKWGSQPGAKFVAGGGQLNPSPYAFQLPANVPNGNYDIEVRAYDDLEVLGTTTLTTVKGAPCADASSCLSGQKCEAGKCFWDQPTAEVGEDCTYNEFCLSNLCAGTADKRICTQSCIPGVTDSCPAESGLECVESAPGKGICFTGEEGGGCCSVEQGSTSRTWLHGALSLGVLGILIGRRRNKRK